EEVQQFLAGFRPHRFRGAAQGALHGGFRKGFTIDEGGRGRLVIRAGQSGESDNQKRGKQMAHGRTSLFAESGGRGPRGGPIVSIEKQGQRLFLATGPVE